MELDKRILPGKRPLTCFDTEEAKKFIGEKGYFNHNLSRFCYLKNCTPAYLRNIFVRNESCFEASRIDWPNTDYKYFLPAEWVKPEEPECKWRSFSLTEWQHDYDIGEEIIFRLKKSDTVRVYEYCGYVSDSDDDSPGKGVINLGGELFVLQNLFDQFELWDKATNKWEPFGVEVTK